MHAIYHNAITYALRTAMLGPCMIRCREIIDAVERMLDRCPNEDSTHLPGAVDAVNALCHIRTSYMADTLRMRLRYLDAAKLILERYEERCGRKAFAAL